MAIFRNTYLPSPEDYAAQSGAEDLEPADRTTTVGPPTDTAPTHPLGGGLDAKHSGFADLLAWGASGAVGPAPGE